MFTISEQLQWKPKVRNMKALNFDNVVVGGMGGSAMPARMLFYLEPTYPVWLHNDYGLPEKTRGKTLFVSISYSGNTAETLSFAKAAYKKNESLVVITSGGELRRFAEDNNLSYVSVPEGLSPRDASMYMLKALLAVLGKDLEETGGELETDAEADEMAEFLLGGTPLIYSSSNAGALAYFWKIYLNETAKISAFYGHFPEVFHNELESINETHRIILLTEVTGAFSTLALEKRWSIKELKLSKNKTENIVRNLVLARSVARKLAEKRGVDPDKTPLIEEFKKKLNG